MKLIALVAALFLLPQSASALGPEDQEFVGKLGRRIVTLTFKADPNLYSGQAKELNNCLYEDDRIACSNGHSDKGQVIYVRGTSASTQFHAARKLYIEIYPKKKIKQWNSEGVYMDDFYSCKTGCSGSVPRLFILISHGD
jgi:hypothetical protein